MKQIDIEKIEKEDQGPILEPEPSKPEENPPAEEASEETAEEKKSEESEQQEEALQDTKEPEKSEAEKVKVENIEAKSIYKPPEPPRPPKPAKKGGSGFLPYFLGLLLGLAVVFSFIYGRAWWTNRKAQEIKPEETTTTPTTEATSTPTETTSATPTETTQATAAPTLDKSTVSIQVLNGNGISGDATKVKSILEKDGFKVASTGNASSFTYQTTVVYYKTGKKDAADAVAQTLNNAGRQAAAQEKSALTKYDVQVVIGKK